MSTRGAYTFKDGEDQFHVYKHYDNHPSKEGLTHIIKTLEYSWELPRFEADEFACAFIRANKERAGDVRLTSHYDNHSDLEYRYEIELKNNDLWISIFSPIWDDEQDKTTWKVEHAGTIYALVKQYKNKKV